ncbi:MAG: UDP-N-acetylmuramate dehydrogenase [Desulfobacteraceae bacterium]|nr:MAG: UDP-N-acetylmuramate dehydrogenase [Desulfobacteraceae bacterium]
MNKRQKQELSRLGRQGVRFDCPMAQHTTFRVGGLAEALYEANDLEDLRQVVAYLNQEDIPYVVVGRGSNLLIKDEGLEGLAILLHGSLASVKQENKHGLTVFSGAGLHLVGLLIYCRNSGLGGLEFLAGIPGTVGGAISMNAGAFGKEIGEKVKEIRVVNARGDVLVTKRSRLKFSYRALQIQKGSVIIGACLMVDKDTEEIVAQRIAGYMKKRKERQPLEFPSAGSIFKNPPNDYAGRLIEQVGLKGTKIGGAMISEKHANYIINTGGAKAKDILGLMCVAREKVRKETGITLEPEIQVIGR